MLVVVLAASAALTVEKMPAKQAWVTAAVLVGVIVLLCWMGVRKVGAAQRRQAVVDKAGALLLGLVVGGTYHWWNPWQ